jgi:uncharacterized protein YqeY
MSELKARLRSDLTAAMKSKQAQTVGTLRLALAAIQVEEVSGKTPRELTDADVQAILAKEVRKRKESAEAFATAGRAEQSATELAEGEILSQYLPQGLSDAEVQAIVDEAYDALVAELGEKPGPRQMGQLVKAVKAKTGTRAEGGTVAGLVKAKLS